MRDKIFITGAGRLTVSVLDTVKVKMTSLNIVGGQYRSNLENIRMAQHHNILVRDDKLVIVG
jgi:hypothetical protein